MTDTTVYPATQEAATEQYTDLPKVEAEVVPLAGPTEEDIIFVQMLDEPVDPQGAEVAAQ